MADSRLTRQRYVLGIDLGTSSLGWAAIGIGGDGAPTRLVRTGVRVFDPAVSGDIEKGRDESNAVARRAARLVRRQLRRRAARQRELFKLLQRNGLLPLYSGEEPDGSFQRHSILNSLDAKISAKWSKAKGIAARVAVELPLYHLRKVALDEPLEPFELGRVFYHLGQRRGYRSNQKERAERQGSIGTAKNRDDLGPVEGEINKLEKEMRLSNSRTLGEYFASLDPHTQKVRRRWTGRKMYEEEFAKIWGRQSSYFPELLTEELDRELKRLLFYQRPIDAQSHLIGVCELEPNERRAAWATLEAQEFRVLHRVNDLEIVYPGQVTGLPLSAEQRQAVIDLLQNSAEATFKEIRKALELPQNVGFNLQRGGETKLKGNFTLSLMVAVFGNRWAEMSDVERKQLVEDWRTIEQEESLIRRAKEYWKLDEPGAKWLADNPAPSGHCLISRKAIQKMIPLMRQGRRFSEAEKAIYGNRFSGGKVYGKIPPVREALTTLGNPAIERSLTEMRKVVNALIQDLGAKPEEVRIELTRDLKKPRKKRAEAAVRDRALSKERNSAKARLLRELGPGFENPSRSDIEKVLLHEECGGICPYTGRPIEFASLFAQIPLVKVEHIIPFSRIPDDSFQNKTLRFLENNRRMKLNQTPYEAYKDPEQYEAILNRVRSWPTPNRGKLARFGLKTTEQLDGFSTRLLNDTRYSSKLACQLIGTLYGGRDKQAEAGIIQVVFASSGILSTTLRRGWGLEAILREAGPIAKGPIIGKPRTDYRHHAIDAITIALSRPSLIAALSRTNARDLSRENSRPSAPKLQVPWKNFVSSIRPHIEQLLISHRPQHRLTGALHDETNYGRPRQENGKNIVHIRKPVPGLSASEIERIVDPRIREAVKEKALQFGGDLRNWTAGERLEDWPQLITKSGQCVPIKRARIKKSLQVKHIAEGSRRRNVSLSSNHHVAIFALLDNLGRERRWEPQVVPLIEAMDRQRRKQQIVQRCLSSVPEAVFKLSLMWGDTLQLHKDCDHRNNICNPSFWRVRSIWEDGTLTMVRINDARLLREIRAAKGCLLPSADSLRKMGAAKVVVDTLGRVHSAGC